MTTIFLGMAVHAMPKTKLETKVMQTVCKESCVQ